MARRSPARTGKTTKLRAARRPALPREAAKPAAVIPLARAAGAAPALTRARVVRMQDVLSGDPATQPDSPEYGKRFLGEGDSWQTFNALPHSANMLEQLHLPEPSIVLTLAKPGDTIRRMADIAANPMLGRYLTDRNFASDWDAILLSGGGNDLIYEVDRIIVAGAGTNAHSWIDGAALTAVLDAVVNGYAAIVRLRDSPGSPSAGRRIVVHTYDYPTPNNAAANFAGVGVMGPWFWTRFEQLGLRDEPLRAAITDHVLDRLADTLVGLASRLPAVEVVDTRGTLVRAAPGSTGNSNDWLNEIHPNSTGYRKIAGRLAAVL